MPNDTVQATIIGDPAAAESTLAGLYPEVPLSVVTDPGQFELPQPTANKTIDVHGQWTAGDNLNNLGAYGCTDDFSYKGNSSGNLYQYTAAHCVSGVGEAVQNDGYTIGHITTVYPNSAHYDFASFECNTCNDYYVWYDNSGDAYTINSDCGSSCYSGQQVTMDPGVAGGNPGIQQPNYNVQWSAPGSVNEGGNTINGVELADSDGSYPDGCPGGSSGAPVYQRHASGTAWGAGEIFANNGSESQCYYEVTSTIEYASNSTLWVF